MVALHPMAGYRSAELFALDAGRMCVTLSRHRAHLTILTDPASAPVLLPRDPQVERAAAVLAALNPAPSPGTTPCRLATTPPGTGGVGIDSIRWAAVAAVGMQ